MGFQSENKNIIITGAVRIEFVILFLETGFPWGPLVADLNHFHMHSDISYGDHFGLGVWVRG